MTTRDPEPYLSANMDPNDDGMVPENVFALKERILHEHHNHGRHHPARAALAQHCVARTACWRRARWLSAVPRGRFAPRRRLCAGDDHNSRCRHRQRRGDTAEAEAGTGDGRQWRHRGKQHVTVPQVGRLNQRRWNGSLQRVHLEIQFPAKKGQGESSCRHPPAARRGIAYCRKLRPVGRLPSRMLEFSRTTLTATTTATTAQYGAARCHNRHGCTSTIQRSRTTHRSWLRAFRPLGNVPDTRLRPRFNVLQLTQVTTAREQRSLVTRAPTAVPKRRSTRDRGGQAAADAVPRQVKLAARGEHERAPQHRARRQRLPTAPRHGTRPYLNTGRRPMPGCTCPDMRLRSKRMDLTESITAPRPQGVTRAAHRTLDARLQRT
jgi:hypothetical protein